MNFSDDLAWRGLIKDKTFADTAWLDAPKTFYHGVDASADSLTIGNLAVLMLARRLMENGWKAVLLVGGATSLIGDPGGKESERELQPREEVLKNVESIKSQISKLFAGQSFTPVDNFDWFSEVKYLEFLREVGKSFSMTEMMQREFVTARMGEQGSGISYAEFSYSLIQGYDYLKLYQMHQAVLQIGGSDQWGNMLSGVSLIRKKENQEVHALSIPLVIDKSSGRKFGKTEAGAVWLDATKTTPTQFFQFWVNVSDEDVLNYLKVFTLLSKDEIVQVMAEHQSDQSQRIAQKRLAEAVTSLIHPDGQTEEASVVTKYLTSQASLSEVSEEELEQLREGIPSVMSTGGGLIVEALTTSGLASSNSEARRLLEAGAVYINGKKIERDSFEESDFQNGRLLLRRGKAYKDSALVELG